MKPASIRRGAQSAPHALRASPIRHLILLAATSAVPVLMGAESKGCGSDVTVGNDDPCVVTGCSGQICADEETASTCEWTDAYACYPEYGICERDADGVCGWRATEELENCLNPDPAPCVVTGCSGEVCADAEQPSDCEWLDEYACYSDVGVCERDASGVCGWRQTQELLDCLANPRTPISGACVRSQDSCTTDSDCVAGGCGGELCFNPAESEGISTCDCEGAPGTCGCINGKCSWYQ
ncbi:MAG: hypothetical protein U0271_46645 [Polyangiaceae bacterium]